MEAKLSGIFEEGKVLAPKPTIGGNENNNRSLFKMSAVEEEMKNTNGSLFEMTLTCKATLKYSV